MDVDVEVLGLILKFSSLFPADQKMLTPPENQPPPIEMRGQAHPQRVAFAKTTVAPSGFPMPDFSNANTQSGQTKGKQNIYPFFC